MYKRPSGSLRKDYAISPRNLAAFIAATITKKYSLHRSSLGEIVRKQFWIPRQATALDGLIAGGTEAAETLNSTETRRKNL